jgi:FAD/FMN-containing dehydrogenase
VLQGQHGFVLDNLVSARVVLGSGKIVDASRTQHPDLFWALRGAGHNFGIVTSLELKIYDVPSKWTVHSLTYGANKLEAVFSLINKLEQSDSGRPAKLAITSLFVRNPAIDSKNVSRNDTE